MMQVQKFKIRRDKNGNKIATIYASRWEAYNYKPRFKAFSIQTLGNLPQCHQLDMGTCIESHFDCYLWQEIMDYIYLYGTKYQKSHFDMLGAKRRYEAREEKKTTSR